MSSESGVKPENFWNTGRILALVACLVAIALSGGASIYFAVNEETFPVGTVIQLFGSLVCLWAVTSYRKPLDKKMGSGAKKRIIR